MVILRLVKELLIELLNLIRGLNSYPNRDKPSLGEMKIMYIVKADNPDVGFNLSFTVTDSEGHVVPDSALVVTVGSDNEEAVQLSVDETGRAGSVHFGSPGLANVNVTVEDNDGDLLGSFGAQFTVTTGDPAAIMGGTLVFEGLSEEVPPVEVPAEEVPAEEVPAEEVPMEEVPAEEVPAEEVPAEEVPMEEVPAEEVPAEEVPAEEVVEEMPAEEVPAEETVDEEK